MEHGTEKTQKEKEEGMPLDDILAPVYYIGGRNRAGVGNGNHTP
jgi:hypothetical protein